MKWTKILDGANNALDLVTKMWAIGKLFSFDAMALLARVIAFFLRVLLFVLLYP